MANSINRISAVAGLLLGTWTIATAAPRDIVASPNGPIDHLRAVSVNFNESTSAVEELKVSPDFGAIAAGSSGTVVVPALVELPAGFTPNSLAFAVGTTPDGGLVLTRIGGSFDTSFLANFPQSDFDILRASAISGDIAGITTFFAQSGSLPPSGRQATFLRTLDGPDLSLTKFSSATALPSSYGTAVFTAVPEPATMAVLGLGLAAMKRRRSFRK